MKSKFTIVAAFLTVIAGITTNAAVSGIHAGHTSSQSVTADDAPGDIIWH